MPDPARIAQAQVLEIPVTIQGEKAEDETGRREPFAESAKTALTFDNGAVVKMQARVKAGESVSLRNEQSGKEIQCKVLEVPPEGQLGYTDLEFVESVPDFWEGHAEQAEVAAQEPEAGVAKSDAESAAEKPEPAAAASEPEAAATAVEPATEAEPAVEAESAAAQEAALDADGSGRHSERSVPSSPLREAPGHAVEEPLFDVPPDNQSTSKRDPSATDLPGSTNRRPGSPTNRGREQRGENQTARDSAQDDGGTTKPEPAPEKHVPATSKAAALVAEAVAALGTVVAQPQTVAAQPEVQAHEETEAAADNSLAMMSATASEVKLPPVKAPEPEEKPQAQIPKGRLREELVPAHEMVPETSSAPVALATPSAPPAPSATEPTGEQIDAALRSMEGALAPAGAAEPNDAKDQANLAALMAREARLAKYALLKDKAASQIGRGPAPQGASKGAEAAAGETGASVEGEMEVEAGPPKAPLSERLTTGRNAVIVEIVAGVAIVVALGFVWHAVRGLFIHPKYQPVAVAAASAKKAVAPTAPPVVVQTLAAPVAKAPAATPPVVASAPVVKAATATSAVAGSAPAAKATAARPPAVASAPAAKIVQPSPPRSEPAEDDGPRVVEPPPASEEPEPVASVAPKAAANIPAKILSAPQPPFPTWAKKLDVGSVVRLDAVIDEKGNLGQTKIVSGPRLLERAAQQAVQLWIFEPAQLGGKPAATHMVLTVEFQR